MAGVEGGKLVGVHILSHPSTHTQEKLSISPLCTALLHSCTPLVLLAPLLPPHTHSHPLTHSLPCEYEMKDIYTPLIWQWNDNGMQCWGRRRVAHLVNDTFAHLFVPSPGDQVPFPVSLLPFTLIFVLALLFLFLPSCPYCTQLPFHLFFFFCLRTVSITIKK